MNIYEKLVEARIKFQSGNPKMSGTNKFAGYTYFELSDILPVINKIAQELHFICEVSFDQNLATLIFRDTEKADGGDYIRFTSPMSTASLKGCHEVQNLGAVETYLKRYLYQNCFEIVESDALNGTQGKDNKKDDTVNIQTIQQDKHAANMKEIETQTVILESYITSGIIAGENKDKAQKCIDSCNLENINKWIAWAKKQEAGN